MRRGVTGREVVISRAGGEIVKAFVPGPLPPTPPLAIGPDLRAAIDSALVSLGRLDSVTMLLPDTKLFLYMYVRKEAVLSSQIEGTQSSLADLLLFELDQTPGVPLDDVVEVSSYVAALEHGMKRLREGFPLSNRLIREIHAILLAKGRGSDKDRGDFRRSQNWIGGSRPGNAFFVPPPADQVPDAMSALEKFLHDIPEKTPTLIKAGLTHVQFETIHPFLDGNGRVGRLLITLLLCSEGILREPLLYLSLYLKRRRTDYYDLLGKVRHDGDWESWLLFLVQGIQETAESAVSTAQRLVGVAAEDRLRVQTLGRKAGSSLRVHQALLQRPLLTIAEVVRLTGLSTPAATGALRALERARLVRETTGRRRNRVFSYERYLAVLREGTEGP